MFQTKVTYDTEAGDHDDHFHKESYSRTEQDESSFPSHAVYNTEHAEKCFFLIRQVVFEGI